MQGQEIYTWYCESCAHLTDAQRRNEALPAWPFLTSEQRRIWERLAKRINEQVYPAS